MWLCVITAAMVARRWVVALGAALLVPPVSATKPRKSIPRRQPHIKDTPHARLFTCNFEGEVHYSAGQSTRQQEEDPTNVCESGVAQAVLGSSNALVLACFFSYLLIFLCWARHRRVG